jgi:hypothetical protein
MEPDSVDFTGTGISTLGSFWEVNQTAVEDDRGRQKAGYTR